MFNASSISVLKTVFRGIRTLSRRTGSLRQLRGRYKRTGSSCCTTTLIAYRTACSITEPSRERLTRKNSGNACGNCWQLFGS